MTFAKTTTLIIALCTLVTGCFYYMEYAESKASQLKKAMGITHNVYSNFLMMRRSEKDFFTDFDITQIDDHAYYANCIDQEIQSIRALKVQAAESAKLLPEIENTLKKYVESFDQLVKLQTSLGINPNHGDYGKLRQAAHQIEHFLSQNHQESQLNHLLNLRRIEKDFMLYPSEDKLAEFETLFKAFDEINIHINYAFEQLSSYIEAKKAYYSHFQDFSQKTLKMGLNDTTGLFGALSQQADHLEQLIEVLVGSFVKLSNTTENKVRQEAKILSFVFPILVFLLAFLPFLSLLSQRSKEPIV